MNTDNDRLAALTILQSTIEMLCVELEEPTTTKSRLSRLRADADRLIWVGAQLARVRELRSPATDESTDALMSGFGETHAL